MAVCHLVEMGRMKDIRCVGEDENTHRKVPRVVLVVLCGGLKHSLSMQMAGTRTHGDLEVRGGKGEHGEVVRESGDLVHAGVGGLWAHVGVGGQWDRVCVVGRWVRVYEGQ